MAHEGSPFRTRRGYEFTYEIAADRFICDRTPWTIRRSDFELALGVVPTKGPSGLPRSVMGPSYVWAVLHDPRVRQDDY